MVDHAVLAGDVHSFQCVVVLGVELPGYSCIMGSILEVKGREDGVASMLVQDDGGPSDVSCLLDSPESDVLLSTTHKSEVVDRAELEAKDVEVGCLLGKDVWLLSAVDARDVPDDDHLLVVRVLSDTG